MPVYILNHQPKPIKKSRLAQLVKATLLAENAGAAEITVLVTDDLTVRRLNREYRKQDRSTDVLSFAQQPSDKPIDGAGGLLGDVVISLPTAIKNAAQYGIPLEEELALLVVHGCLHLLGYEDETVAGNHLMRERETAVLKQYGYSNVWEKHNQSKQAAS
ncbi:MAG: rRNA maturation RNase YbeY [Armatimonadetes bacterium]|nr:rRNA maturation RNase YbeY [Armatimonadota bacterium]